MFGYEFPGFTNLPPRKLPISFTKRRGPIQVEPKHRFRRTCSAVSGVDMPWLMVARNDDKAPAPRRYRRHAIL